MTSNRDRFIDRQAQFSDEFARLTSGEGELVAFFSLLAMETYDVLAPQGACTFFGFSTWPESAFFFLRPGHSVDKVPLSILERWQQWEGNYPEVEARNPRLELRNLMQTMSETTDAMSWPQEAEWMIERWVAGGDIDLYPYYRDERLYARFRALHERLNGWLYQDDNANIHFAELEEFRAIGRRRDEARRELIQREAEKYAAARARSEESRRGLTIQQTTIKPDSEVQIFTRIKPPK